MKNSSKIKKEKKPLTKEKKRNIIIGVVSACLVVVMTLAIVLPIVLRAKKDTPFKIPALSLPIEEQYALQKYNYSKLTDTVVTLRTDVMNVIERNVPRPQVEELSDKFALVYTKNEATKASTLSTYYGRDGEDATFNSYVNSPNAATIEFTNYPAPAHTVTGSGAFLNGTSGSKTIDSSSSDFYKYMLMTQGQHLAKEAQERSKNGSLTQEWLKKHPAADAQFGAVVGENNAVIKEITLDPIYRSFHATGLYLPAGEVVKVKVENLAPGERIAVTVNVQNSLAWRGGVTDSVYNSLVQGTSLSIQSVDAYFTKADVITANGYFEGNVTNQSQWVRQSARAPWITADFIFDHNGEYNIGTPFGGVMHINMGNCYSSAKTTFYGAVETPHYILGVTTPEYFDTYLKNAPGVIGVLDTENGQLVGPTGTPKSYVDPLSNYDFAKVSYMRNIKIDEVDKLANLWHSFFAVNESYTGGTYNRNNIVKFDWHVPAGAAVALGGYVYACPTGWFGSAMNYRGLLQSGTWGTLHEIGHNHGSAYGTVWGFGGSQEGEVRNNALTLLSYIRFCDVGTTVRNGGRAEHGAYADPYLTLGETLRNKDRTADFNNFGYFEALGMYANIMHSFSAEKFYELLYSYKAHPAFVPDGTGSNRRADFNYRCSTIFGMNFTRYFNNFYNAGISNDIYTAEQLEYMNSLPNYEPVANKYAGGIDGIKTSGDYLVAFGSDIEFDLQSTTISTLDEGDKKGFKIISVAKPTHGTITDLKNGKYSYSFNKEYTGTFDEIKFKVKLSDGVIHELTIYLRISYNGGRLTTYNSFDALSGGINDKNWQTVIDKQSSLGFAVKNNISSNIVALNSGTKWQVRVLDFYWKAPETGNIKFYFKQDDGLIFYFGNDFDSLEELARYNHDSSSWTSESDAALRYVEKGQYYAIRLYNLNTGGNGSASIGYKYEGGEISSIPNSQIFHPDYPLGQEFETYIFEPEFMVSKKDKIKLSTTGTDKTDWKIIEAPDDEHIHQGRTNRVELARFDSEGNLVTQLSESDKTNPNVVLKNGVVYDIISIDKWSYLIDGDVGTILHTRYGTNAIKYPNEEPYVFTIDTGKVQQFNYFSVTTRTGALEYSKITKYELQISSDGKNYTTVASGDVLEYERNIATLRFNTVSGRYLKLLVKGTTGNNRQFVVIAELDAGITSTTQRIVPASSPYLFATDGWVNTATVDSEKSGYLMSTGKYQKLVFRFKGNNVAVYAAVGEGYGSADIKLDGKFIQTSNFNSKTYDARKLMLNFEDLEDGVHTLEIITKSTEKVMINLFGVSYTAELVNAPNIYLERTLKITVAVFVILFALLLAFVLCLLFIPKFRKLMGGNKAIAALDRYLEKQSEKRKAKRAARKKEKRLAKESASLDSKSGKTQKLSKSVTKKEETELKLNGKKETYKEAKKPNKIEKNESAKTVTKSAKPEANKTAEVKQNKVEVGKPVSKKSAITETKKPTSTKKVETKQPDKKPVKSESSKQSAKAQEKASEKSAKTVKTGKSQEKVQPKTTVAKPNKTQTQKPADTKKPVKSVKK